VYINYERKFAFVELRTGEKHFFFKVFAMVFHRFYREKFTKMKFFLTVHCQTQPALLAQQICLAAWPHFATAMHTLLATADSHHCPKTARLLAESILRTVARPSAACIALALSVITTLCTCVTSDGHLAMMWASACCDVILSWVAFAKPVCMLMSVCARHSKIVISVNEAPNLPREVSATVLSNAPDWALWPDVCCITVAVDLLW